VLRPITRRHLLFSAAALLFASTSALALLASGEVMPSIARDPLSDFVQPGVTVWWLVLGGPFRTGPSSAGGIVFAALANTAFWLVCLWVVAALFALVRRDDRGRHQ
jgi:hypothetical protein